MAAPKGNRIRSEEIRAQGGWSSSALRFGDSPTAAEGTASDVTIANGECVVAKVRRFL